MSELTAAIKSADWKSEKHAPNIDCPDSFAPDQAIEVCVQVGKEIRHPNTTEHFINWIELYFKPEGASNLICLGRADFSSHGESLQGPNQGPAYTEPVFTTRLFLKSSGTLVACSYCNLHGLWESTKAVTLLTA